MPYMGQSVGIRPGYGGSQTGNNFSNMYTNPQQGMGQMMSGLFNQPRPQAAGGDPMYSSPMSAMGGALPSVGGSPRYGSAPTFNNPYGPSQYNPYEYDPATGGRRPSNRGPADWNAVPNTFGANWNPNGERRPLSPHQWGSYGDPSYYSGGYWRAP